jgi:transcriptional regulator with XRE-family HTH domain
MTHQRNLEIGQRLRLLRKSLGMTQGSLGNRVQSTAQNIQKYETGNNGFLFNKIEEFATVFSQEFQNQGSDPQSRNLINYLIWGNAKIDADLQNANLNIETQFKFPDGIEDPVVRKNFIKLMEAVAVAYNNYDTEENNEDLKRLQE